jgi:hypothetical protein
LACAGHFRRPGPFQQQLVDAPAGPQLGHLYHLVHLVALLTFAHWVFSAFDPLTAYLHLAVLGVLEAVRLWKTHGPRKLTQ